MGHLRPSVAPLLSACSRNMVYNTRGDLSRPGIGSSHCTFRPPVLERKGRRMPRTKALWIRDDYLEQILGGRKTVEVQVAYPNIARLEPGDTLLLNERHRYTITDVRCCPTFEALAAAENPASIAPDLSHPDDLVRACRALYPPEKEALGVVALEIIPAKGTSSPIS